VRTTRDAAPIARTYERLRSRVFLSIILGYGTYYTCRVNLGAIKQPLLDAGLFDARELGWIGSALLVGYAAGKLVNGFLADRANIRRFISAGLLASAFVNLVLGGGVPFSIFFVAWGLNGWFQSMGGAPSVVAMSNWFSWSERGTRYGIWSVSHSLGEGFTFLITSALVARFGWRWGFWGPGLLCVLGALVLSRTLADRPETLGLPPVADYRGDHPPVHEGPDTVGHMQIEVLRMPAIWLLGIASAANYVTRYALSSWGQLYLQKAKGYSLEEAGSLLAAYAVAAFVGSFVSGWISDRFFSANRYGLSLLSGLLQSAALLALWLIVPGHVLLDLAAFVLLGLTMGLLVAFLGGLMAVDLVPHRVAGAAAGAIGMFSYIGAALQDTVSGHLIESGRSSTAGVETYAFDGAFAFWTGATLVATLLVGLVWMWKLRIGRVSA